FCLGDALRANQQDDQARDAYLRCVELHREQGIERTPFLAGTWNILCVLARNTGRLEEAAGHAREATRSSPHEPRGWSELAMGLDELGRRDEARQAALETIRRAKRILRRQPDHLETLKDAARAHAVLGRFPQAAAALRKAVAIDPADGEAR